MLNRLSKLVVLAAVAASTLVGCKAASAPEEPTAPVAKAEPKGPFTLDTKDGWRLIDSQPLDAREPTVVSVYRKDVGADLTLVAGVLAINLPASDVDTFLADVREAVVSSDKMSVVKERLVKIGALRAYEYVAIRLTEDGPVASVSLVATGGKVGYSVQCNGDINQAEVVLPECAKFVESFRLSGK